MSREPSISVVIVVTDSLHAAETARRSIGDGCVEIIIAASDETHDAPTLRRLGANAASGEIVAFLEDSCIAQPGWLAAVRASFNTPDVIAVSGPVEQSIDARSTDWAVYFAEYASFARYSLRLAGPNFAVRRECISGDGPIHESEIRGDVNWLSHAKVTHIRRYEFRLALADRFRFGREYGERRWQSGTKPWTYLGLLAAPAILGLQLFRLARAIVSQPQLFWPFLRSAVPSVVLLASWSLGEAMGWSMACRRVAHLYEKAGRIGA